MLSYFIAVLVICYISGSDYLLHTFSAAMLLQCSIKNQLDKAVVGGSTCMLDNWSIMHEDLQVISPELLL